MLYRKMGKTGESVSILGFGCMRLPVKDGRPDLIDEAKASEMFEYAIDRGVNYFDTAYPYHSGVPMQKGMSEVFTGDFMSRGYRDKVFLAMKLPSWLINSREDMDRYLNEQLERLKTDRIDFYLVHALKADFWSKLEALGVREFLDAALADGRIKHAGFSFHDKAGVFRKIVDSYDWSFCQIQFNYMDHGYQAGLEGLRYAHERGLGVAVMEPLKGGMLASNIPGEIIEVLNAGGTNRRPADIALRHVWSYPEAGVVLSGMSEMSHVVENIESVEEFARRPYDSRDAETIDKIRDIFRSKIKVGCTACGYCMPCPEGVNIPGVFQLFNTAFMFNSFKAVTFQYNVFMPAAARASKCSKCGKCEKACPQKIRIIDTLAEAARTFEA